jgi:hypothetical protein
MNSDKTDLILFGSHVNLARFATHDCSLHIGSDTIIVAATVVRVLGVQLDAELSMKAYITKTTASCLYHLRRLRQVRRRAGEDVTARLVHAGFHNIAVGLLQLVTCRFTKVLTRPTAAGAECRSIG